MSSQLVPVSAAVEGDLDEAVVRRIANDVNVPIDAVYGKKGKSYLRQHIKGYNRAASFSPWLVLVDLNHEADCAPPLRGDWLPRPSSGMCFRIAVREIEAWLMGDREGLARLLAVSVEKIPLRPELVQDPKQALVALARQSRRTAVREGLVPDSRSGRRVGPLYAATLIEFASDTKAGWKPQVARKRCDSLDRCMRRLQEFGMVHRGSY